MLFFYNSLVLLPLTISFFEKDFLNLLDQKNISKKIGPEEPIKNYL